MKKILFVTNMLLLGIIIFQACNNDKKKPDTPAVNNPKNDCMSNFCKNYDQENLRGMISAVALKEMSEVYSQDANKAINHSQCPPAGDPKLAAQDGLSVVFDIEKLKNIIFQMEQKRCENNCDTSVKLGIRYYYITYPCDLREGRAEDDGLDRLSPKLRGKHSLAMVPVVKNNTDGKWYDYHLWLASRENCFPGIELTYQNPKHNFRAFIPDPADNHGGIGPPPAPGTFPTNPEGQ